MDALERAERGRFGAAFVFVKLIISQVNFTHRQELNAPLSLSLSLSLFLK